MRQAHAAGPLQRWLLLHVIYGSANGCYQLIVGKSADSLNKQAYTIRLAV
jgi:hypothetical protein